MDYGALFLDGLIIKPCLTLRHSHRADLQWTFREEYDYLTIYSLLENRCKYCVLIIERVPVTEVSFCVFKSSTEAIGNWVQMSAVSFGSTGLPLPLIYLCDLCSLKEAGNMQK